MALGIDVGSVSVKVVLVSAAGAIVCSRYARSLGRPRETLAHLLAETVRGEFAERVVSVGLTGSGSPAIHAALGGVLVNEVVAQAEGASRVVPDALSIVEIGGQDSKYIVLSRRGDRPGVSDFATNSLCAAGTGSFLDQQAARLGLSVEDGFGEMALRCAEPPRIAGRCSVFAKSDMIHLQQIGAPVEDIVAGLCFAVARNFRAQILHGAAPPSPVAFVGGVAGNAGVVRAFRELLGPDGSLVVPPEHGVTAAMGAALIAMRAGVRAPFAGADALDVVAAVPRSPDGHPPLRFSFPELKHYAPLVFPVNGGPPTDVYLGIDVGSLSTNVVVLDGDGHVVARRYLMTAGRPIEAVARGLGEVASEVAGRVAVRGVGATGSGRVLIGEIVGADVVRNEITAQATAALAFDETVDTIFEIGGQDSKYISLHDGVVVDFEMNRACAAGTGSFLQEQAERLGVSIEREFADCALRSGAPADCGERCTVFMDSELTSHQMRGVPRDDLASGLAYAIVDNYLRRVVSGRRIGKRVFFQGGVAWNRAVVAAFEHAIGRPVIVPPHHDVTGAIGAAMLARDRGVATTTRFRGWDAASRAGASSTFTCRACENECEVHRVATPDGAITSGGRCDRHDSSRAPSVRPVLDLFESRKALLFEAHREVVGEPVDPRGTVGIPLALMMWEYLPFFRAFVESLGWATVVSGETTRPLLKRGLEACSAETCFPAKAATGHVIELLRLGADAVLWPSLISLPNGGKGAGYLCPYVQASPYLLSASNTDVSTKTRWFAPALHVSWGVGALERELSDVARALGAGLRDLRRAVRNAGAAQDGFSAKMRELGHAALARLEDERSNALVLVGRPYTTCDMGLSLSLARRVGALGVQALPMDALPLDGAAVDPRVFWRSGGRVVAAMRRVAGDPRLYAVVVTNFACGPDSFILHRVREAARDKPYLTLELDEHAADAGVMTRVEAFLDGLRSRERRLVRASR